jgi:hypothetical protein
MQPAGLPGRTTGRGAATTSYASTPAAGIPFPRSTPIIGERAPASRTPLAPLTRPGYAPVLDPARPPARTWHLRGERESDEASQPCPANTSADAKLQAETPLDTGSLLQG